MIIARVKGGLGNQLFIYAAARRLALFNSIELVLDDKSGFERDFTYQRTYQLDKFNIPFLKANRSKRLEPFSRIRRYLKRKFNELVPFESRTYICQQGDSFDARLLTLSCKKDVWLEGYWQSERYFKNIEAVIRNDLQITPPADDINVNLALRINGCIAIAVHIRLFDNPDEFSSNNITSIYYEKAIAIIERIAPDAHYFIFSDQPNAVIKRFVFPKGRFTFVSHNLSDEHAYADLWLMSLCQHFIIANSTFSWWGAWLSVRQGKCVIAPAVRITHGKMAWGFEGLLPDEWIKL